MRTQGPFTFVIDNIEIIHEIVGLKIIRNVGFHLVAAAMDEEQIIHLWQQIYRAHIYRKQKYRFSHIWKIWMHTFNITIMLASLPGGATAVATAMTAAAATQHYSVDFRIFRSTHRQEQDWKECQMNENQVVSE